MKLFVTGAAGFIGSNVVDRLLSEGHEVVGFDNFVTGRREFLENAGKLPTFAMTKGDLLDTESLRSAMAGCEAVVHLAANADVRFGLDHPGRDLEQNTIVTFNVLEAMRANGIKRLIFSSTGSVYGEPEVFPTPEDAPFPLQTSLYGASKLACEGMISAYCTGYGFQATIFRFVSILGERYTHGHVFDFVRALRRDPSRLRVLGNGEQRKSYLYVGDCANAVVMVLDHPPVGVDVLNLGTDEYCQVNDSIGWICARLGVHPAIEHAGGERGWVGDSPFIHLNCGRIRALGWTPSLSIRQGVEKTVDYLQANRWVMDPLA
ncbi:MAG: NAD-dependent epimerase/dehydratase family protein [Gemmatimonas sp.]